MPKDYPDWTSSLSYAEAVLYTGVDPQPFAPAQLDVSLLSTITVQSINFAANTTLQLDFLDESGAVVGIEFVTAQQNDYADVQFPVIGNLVNIYNPLGSMGSQVVVLGSNRQINNPRHARINTLPRQFALNSVAFSIGTAKQLIPSDGLDVWTSLNGPVTIATTTIGVAGIVFAQYASKLGTNIFIQANLDTAAGQATLATVQHPVTNYRWWFRPDTTVASASVTVSIISSGG